MQSQSNINEKITIVVGDLTKQFDCDVIVNSANPSMLAGSGVSGAIHRAAGPELAQFGKIYAPLSLGQAVITPGFNLPNPHVIHVRAPKFHLDHDPPGMLRLCLLNALNLATTNKLKRMAIPAIATGIYGYPIKEAIQIYIDSARAFLSSSVVEEIRFVFFEEGDANQMRKQLQALKNA